MPPSRLGRLRGCGKVNEAIRKVDRRAGEDPGAFRRVPQRYVADFVDDRQNTRLVAVRDRIGASALLQATRGLWTIRVFIPTKPLGFGYLIRNGGWPWRTNARC